MSGIGKAWEHQFIFFHDKTLQQFIIYSQMGTLFNKHFPNG